VSGLEKLMESSGMGQNPKETEMTGMKKRKTHRKPEHL